MNNGTSSTHPSSRRSSEDYFLPDPALPLDARKKNEERLASFRAELELNGIQNAVSPVFAPNLPLHVAIGDAERQLKLERSHINALATLVANARIEAALHRPGETLSDVGDAAAAGGAVTAVLPTTMLALGLGPQPALAGLTAALWSISGAGCCCIGAGRMIDRGSPARERLEALEEELVLRKRDAADTQAWLRDLEVALGSR